MVNNSPASTCPVGSTAPVVVPSSPSTSTLYTTACLLMGNVMPPGAVTSALSTTQCQVIDEWISEGAAND